MMRSLFRSSLKWLVLAAMCFQLATLMPGLARADTITTFNVAGALSPSGTLLVDVSAGAVTSVSLTFPTLATFDVLTTSGTFVTGWAIDAENSASDLLFLPFTTTPTPGSLVGFEGGTISSGEVLSATDQVLFTIPSGSIAPVPEPPAFLLMVAGLGWLGLACRTVRRRAQRNA
jgi:hypothetical protein